MFKDIDRICRILDCTDRPIQVIFAGKAHPKDEPGKRFIQEISNLEKDFLAQDHPTTSPYSWDHRNFRIEVYGLKLYGVKEMIFSAIDPVRISRLKLTVA